MLKESIRCQCSHCKEEAITDKIARLQAERDALRAVYDAATKYCGDRTVMHEHALIDAVGAVAVQP